MEKSKKAHLALFCRCLKKNCACEDVGPYAFLYLVVLMITSFSLQVIYHNHLVCFHNSVVVDCMFHKMSFFSNILKFLLYNYSTSYFLYFCVIKYNVCSFMYMFTCLILSFCFFLIHLGFVSFYFLFKLIL